ncbi:hypothetical protein ACFPTY_19955 [Halomonas beimenensis]|uniref:hypothetical protein n=1 Tax=Halomonas beimenensis TaxID=475662 RepID=UPI00360CB936
MLQEVIRQNQHTLNMVIEDINYLTKELSTALAEESVTRGTIPDPGGKAVQYTRASKILSNKVEQAESDKSRLNSPETLDLVTSRGSPRDHKKGEILRHHPELLRARRNCGGERWRNH